MRRSKYLAGDRSFYEFWLWLDITFLPSIWYVSHLQGRGGRLLSPTFHGRVLGRNPVSKHQIQPEYGDEQADAGRDG